MATGWIKLHRNITGWEWYHDTNTFRVFVHLLLRANHEDKKWEGHMVKRGQVIIGRKTLAEETNLSEQNIRTALNHLKSTNEITTKPTNKFTLVTIINYDKYQGDTNCPNQQNDQQDNQRLTSNQPATNHKQEYKNEKNETNNIYTDVYKHYLSCGLVQHKALTNSMKKAIDLAMKEYHDVELLKRMATRHDIKVKSSAQTEYPIKKRSLVELYGQKKFGSVSLICSDYTDEVWDEYDKDRKTKKLFTNEEKQQTREKTLELIKKQELEDKQRIDEKYSGDVKLSPKLRKILEEVR